MTKWDEQDYYLLCSPWCKMGEVNITINFPVKDEKGSEPFAACEMHLVLLVTNQNGFFIYEPLKPDSPRRVSQHPSPIQA